MENASERLTGLADHGKEPGNVGAGAGVGLHDFDLGPGIAQLLEKGFGFRRGRAAATGENKMTRTRLDKPVCQDFSESAERACDQVSPVRPDIEVRRDGLAAP